MNKISKIILPLFIILSPVLVLAQENDNFCSGGVCPGQSGNNPGEMMGGGGMQWFSGANHLGPLGILLVVLFWVIIFVGIVYLIRYLVWGISDRQRINEQQSVKRDNKMRLEEERIHNDTDEKAVRILKERYARGEINRKEFREKMIDLKE